jgi:hypothetical protein
MLRSVDVIPTAHLVTTVETINARAAESLQVRLDNEDMLLEHGRERPLFGWGGYGRNRIYDEAGRGISITDGAWIIVIGIRGWAGYLGQFGLLTLPIIILALNRRRYEVSAVTAVLALVLSAALIDLLPNAFLSPVILLLAGALWGRLELGAAVQEKKQAAGPEAPNGQPAYARAHPSAEDPEDTGNVSAHTTANQGSAYTRQTVRHRRLERPY